MRYLKFIKKFFRLADEEKILSQRELEIRLEKKIKKGDVFAALKILRQLDRPFVLTHRLAMIQSCLANNNFSEAFYLVRDLPSLSEKQKFLAIIVKNAAFGDDYSTARNAALLSERLNFH